MAHFAAALTRATDGWHADDLELERLADLDEVADELRDVAARHAGSLALLLLEEDDEYVAVVRVDGDHDPRVFLSDSRAVEGYRLAALVYDEAAAGAVVPGRDPDDETVAPTAEPVGDTELLADVGTPGEVLLQLCAEEGMLPADVITAVCERAGCLEQLEELR